MSKSIKVNFIYNSAYQILLILTPIITTPYLSRVIGQDGNGLFSFTQSVTNYFVMFATLGLANYGVRTIAECGEDRAKRSKTFWDVYLMQLCIGFVVIAAYVCFVVFASSPGERAVWLSWGMWVLAAILDVSWLLFGCQEFRIPTIRSFITRLLSVLVIILGVRGPDYVWVYVVAIAGAFLANSILVWPFVRKYVDWHKPAFRDAVTHLKPNLVLFIPVIATSLYTQLDKIMLGLLGGYQQAGIFDYSEKISKMPLSVITALGAVVLPKMSEFFSQGRYNEGKGLVKSTMWFMLAMAFCFAFGISAIAPEFAPVFLGEGYDVCVPIMCVLSMIIPIICITNVLGVQYLLPLHRDKQFSISTICGGIVNVAINLFAIPRFGAMGAAVATVCAEIAVLSYQAFAVRGELDGRAYVRGALPFVGIGAIMFGVVRLVAVWLTGALGVGVISLLLEVLIGGIVYLALAFVYCALAKPDDFTHLFPGLARLLGK